MDPARMFLIWSLFYESTSIFKPEVIRMEPYLSVTLFVHNKISSRFSGLNARIVIGISLKIRDFSDDGYRKFILSSLLCFILDAATQKQPARFRAFPQVRPRPRSIPNTSSS
jgi:hypothetical protein